MSILALKANGSNFQTSLSNTTKRALYDKARFASDLVKQFTRSQI